MSEIKTLNGFPLADTTAREGVRQLTEEMALLDAEVEELKDNQVPDYVTTTYTQYNTMAIDTSGATADLNETFLDKSWRHLVIWCEAGSVAYVTGKGGTKGRAWALVAKDGTVISASAESETCNNTIVNVINDCYIVVNSMSSSEYSLTITSPKKKESTTEKRLATNVFVQANNWAVGRITANGGIGSVLDFTVDESATNYRWQIIDCYVGMRINIEGRGGDASKLWCFVDKDNKIVDCSDAYEKGAELTSKINGKCLIHAEVVSTFPMSVEYTPYSLEPVLKLAVENKAEIENINNGLRGRAPFGLGIDCKYTAPNIDALVLPEEGERLSYFYGLYDSLLAAYPEYISKVDCDDVAVAAGIERPAAMNDCPIYLYKFIPAYTPRNNDLGATTAQRSKVKVLITNGTHPEYMAIWDTFNTMRLICESWKTDDNLEALRWDCEIYVMPCSGAYVVENGGRVNYNGVDLSRNAPSSDWRLSENDGRTYSGPSAGSEYETKVLVHFIELLSPDVYIDHHNTDPVGDPSVVTWGIAENAADIDVLCEHISVMTRRWKKRFDTVFPNDDTTMLGYARLNEIAGSRGAYGAEVVDHAFIIESQTTLSWENGEMVSGAHKLDTVACTCATDGFINFLLRMLKTFY